MTTQPRHLLFILLVVTTTITVWVSSHKGGDLTVSPVEKAATKIETLPLIDPELRVEKTPPVKPTQVILSHREVSTIDLASVPTYDVYPFSPIVGENVWYEVLGTTSPDKDVLILRDIALDKIILRDYGDELKKLRTSSTPEIVFYPDRGGLIRVTMAEGSGYMPEYQKATVRQSLGTFFLYPSTESFVDTVGKFESGDLPLPKSPERRTKGEPEREIPIEFDRN